MKLDSLFLADAISTPPDGKFYVHGGGFSRIDITSLPSPIPFSVLARFLVEDGDARREHRFMFTLVGPAGVPNVDPIGGVATPPDETPDLVEGEEHFINVALDIPAFAIREGIYTLKVEVNDKVVRRVSLPVVVGGEDPKPQRRAAKSKPGPKKTRAKTKRPPPPPRKAKKRRR
jgi:hypothetical protein